MNLEVKGKLPAAVYYRTQYGSRSRSLPVRFRMVLKKETKTQILFGAKVATFQSVRLVQVFKEGIALT